MDLMMRRRALMGMGGNSNTDHLLAKYIAFEAIEDGTFSFTGSGLYYSTDGSTWTSIAADTATPMVAAGNKIYFKGEMTPTASGVGTFSSTGRFNAMGNAMSLLYGDNAAWQHTLSDYSLCSLFNGCTTIIDASALQLVATSIGNRCYQSMFQSCTSLTSAPELPATDLGMHVYRDMFKNCYSLTNAPSILPATTLNISCYATMFGYCRALVTAPFLPAETLEYSDCYKEIFYGCTSLNYIKAMFTTTPSRTYTDTWVYGVAANGTFVKNASATWDVTGANGVPSGWTIETADS